MQQLTTRQHEILGFLQLHFQGHGYWPSIREIQDHFGFNSTNAVVGHLKALERKGCIVRSPGQARAYRVTYDTDDNVPADAIDVLDIPVYGSIAAGYPDGVETGGEIGRLQIDAETVGVKRARDTFALRVRGDSMVGAGIFDGDTVIVTRGTPMPGDIVAALIDGETTLKRLVQKARGKPYLQAENPDYPELHPMDELRVQGIVKAVVRSL